MTDLELFPPEKTLIPLVIRSREEWGALPPKYIIPIEEPVKNVMCYFTKSDPAFSHEEAVRNMKALQEKDLTKKKKPDIRYSFVIVSDGTVYEGRGWTFLPYLSPYYVKDKKPYLSIGIMWNREVNRGYPPKEMIWAQEELIKYGIRHNYIHEDFEQYILYY